MRSGGTSARAARGRSRLPPPSCEAAEAAVEHEPRPQRRRPHGPSAVDGDEERARPHEVRGDHARERVPLGVRLAHEADVAHLQVAQAAVDELGGRARRGARQVAALHQRDAQPGAGPEPGDRAADDAAAHDEQVEALACERLERVVAGTPASHVSAGAAAGASGAGSRAHSAVPSSAAGGIVQSASTSPIESASRPIANEATPPRPIERPIERPAAVESRVGRYSCETTIVIPNVEITPAPANAIPGEAEPAGVGEVERDAGSSRRGTSA